MDPDEPLGRPLKPTEEILLRVIRRELSPPDGASQLVPYLEEAARKHTTLKIHYDSIARPGMLAVAPHLPSMALVVALGFDWPEGRVYFHRNPHAQLLGLLNGARGAQAALLTYWDEIAPTFGDRDARSRGLLELLGRAYPGTIRGFVSSDEDDTRLANAYRSLHTNPAAPQSVEWQHMAELYRLGLKTGMAEALMACDDRIAFLNAIPRDAICVLLKTFTGGVSDETWDVLIRRGFVEKCPPPNAVRGPWWINRIVRRDRERTWRRVYAQRLVEHTQAELLQADARLRPRMTKTQWARDWNVVGESIANMAKVGVLLGDEGLDLVARVRETAALFPALDELPSVRPVCLDPIAPAHLSGPGMRRVAFLPRFRDTIAARLDGLKVAENAIETIQGLGVYLAKLGAAYGELDAHNMHKERLKRLKVR